jgi:predicted transcriptional regulator
MSITLELPESLTAELRRYAEESGQTPDAFVEAALRRQIAVAQFRARRERLAVYGQRAGLVTDDDVFAEIS